MPAKPQRPCGRPGCSALVQHGQYCAAHSRDRKAGRSTTERGYGADWQRIRRQVLQEEPLCRRCSSEGRVSLAMQVDHIIPIEDAPRLRLERSNLQGLCDACHQAKTAADVKARKSL